MLFKKRNMLNFLSLCQQLTRSKDVSFRNFFFELLAYAKDQKQKKNIIRFINKSQLNVIKNIAKKLLNGGIHLSRIQFHILKNKKKFLRKLSQGKIKIKDLPQEYTIVCYIKKLGLEHYETYPKISSRTCRKVGENRRQYSCERSNSEISSSEECILSEESCFSCGESEIEKSTRIRETSIAERESDASSSHSGEEEEST